MGIDDDDITTSYTDISSAELPQPGGGEVGTDGIELPFNLDGHASGDPQSVGLDGGADGGPTGVQGPADAGPFDDVRPVEDGGADTGPTSGAADLAPGEEFVEGKQDSGADGQVP